MGCILTPLRGCRLIVLFHRVVEILVLTHPLKSCAIQRPEIVNKRHQLQRRRTGVSAPHLLLLGSGRDLRSIARLGGFCGVRMGVSGSAPTSKATNLTSAFAFGWWPRFASAVFGRQPAGHHPIRLFPATRSKWRSRLSNGSSCWRQRAAIQTSLVGIGLPCCLNSRVISA